MRLPEANATEWIRAALRGAVVVCTLASVVPCLAADDRDPFPEIQPSTRAEAVDFLVRQGPASQTLTPRILLAQRDALGISPSLRRALSLLERRVAFAREQAFASPDGTIVRFTTDSTAFDAVPTADLDGDGRPDLLQAVLTGLEQGRALLVDRLALPAPDIEVILAELDGRVDGYLVPGRAEDQRNRIVVEASPDRDLDRVRRAVVREYGHAVALGIHSRYSPSWVAAIGTWSVLAVSGDGPDATTAELLSRRAAHMAEGLVSEGPGNALWLAFLDEYYGPGAVASAVEEIGKGGALATALDRAVRRVSSDDLAAALREFHVWTVLLGERADGHHFSFAPRLAAPPFASDAPGLPALSVQTDAPVSPLGSAQVRLNPDFTEGGMRVQFEGDFAARWEVDLVLVGRDATKRRVPLALSEGRADHTVPAGDLHEAWLLIRNLGSDADGPRRYSYTAQQDKGFPFDLAAFDATVADGGKGVVLSWETASERAMFAFNVLRTREDGGSTVIVNPVWIPALGGNAAATSYRFLDRSAMPGVSYVYTLQGITADGLTSEAGSASVRTASER